MTLPQPHTHPPFASLRERVKAALSTHVETRGDVAVASASPFAPRATWMLLLHERLGVHLDDHAALADTIRDAQLPGGAWTRNGTHPELSATIEGYWGLMLAGEPLDAPHMRAARDALRTLGPLSDARPLTRTLLALFGQLDWSHLKEHTRDLSTPSSPTPTATHPWHACRAALTILSARPVRYALPPWGNIGHDTTPGTPRASWLQNITRLISTASPATHNRADRAIQLAERWLLEHRTPHGWGDFHSTWLAILALHSLGYANNHDAIAQPLASLHTHGDDAPQTTDSALLDTQNDDGSWNTTTAAHAFLTPTALPCPEATARAILSLIHDTQLDPITHPALTRAIRFLTETQRPDGLWFSPRGGLLRTTLTVTRALRDAGLSTATPLFQRITHGLCVIQNPDKTWGEDLDASTQAARHIPLPQGNPLHSARAIHALCLTHAPLDIIRTATHALLTLPQRAGHAALDLTDPSLPLTHAQREHLELEAALSALARHLDTTTPENPA